MNLAVLSLAVTLLLGLLGFGWAVISKLGDRAASKTSDDQKRMDAERAEWREQTRDLISNLRADLDKQATENRDLKAQVTNLQTLVATLLTQQQQALATATQSEKGRAEALTRVEQLEAELDDVRAQLIGLQNENAALRREIADMKRAPPPAAA